MKYGIVVRNIADLRARERFHSERKSQLLFGEPVAVIKRQNGYLKVIQPDSYEGWVDEKCLDYCTKGEYETYLKRLNFQVISSMTKIIPVYKKPDNSKIPQYLFYGTRLKLKKKTDKYGIVSIPNGKYLKISLNNIEPIANKINPNLKMSRILREAKRFLGTPYLWGGVTPFGFDCSGLVQMVYRRFGIILPRDSRDQKKAGWKIAREDIKTGDLLFFPGHVVIAIGKHRLIHASLGEGGVQMNSVRSGDSDFRKDLYDSFIEARRVLK